MEGCLLAPSFFGFSGLNVNETALLYTVPPLLCLHRHKIG